VIAKRRGGRHVSVITFSAESIKNWTGVFSRAAASTSRKGSTKILAGSMRLLKNVCYCINHFAECEDDVGGCNLPNSRDQKSGIAVRAALTVTRQSSSIPWPSGKGALKV